MQDARRTLLMLFTALAVSAALFASWSSTEQNSERREFITRANFCEYSAWKAVYDFRYARNILSCNLMTKKFMPGMADKDVLELWEAGKKIYEAYQGTRISVGDWEKYSDNILNAENTVIKLKGAKSTVYSGAWKRGAFRCRMVTEWSKEDNNWYIVSVSECKDEFRGLRQNDGRIVFLK